MRLGGDFEESKRRCSRFLHAEAAHKLWLEWKGEVKDCRADATRQFTRCLSLSFQSWWEVHLSWMCASGGKECRWVRLPEPENRGRGLFSGACVHEIQHGCRFRPSADESQEGRSVPNHHGTRRHCCSRVLGHPQAVSLRVRRLPLRRSVRVCRQRCHRLTT